MTDANNDLCSAVDERHPTMLKFDSLTKISKDIIELSKTLDLSLKSISKDMKKVCKKRRKSSGSPSNLLKPIAISNELADLFGQAHGTMLTRGQITSAVNKYAHDAGIKKPGDGRVIIVDKVLAKFLSMEEGGEIRIFKVAGQLSTAGHIRSA